MKILVIRFSSGGDVVLTSPFLRALRATYPEAAIDVVTKKEYEPLLRHSPRIDRVITLPERGRLRDLLRMKSALIAETDGAYEIVVDLHDSLRSRYLRAGMGRRISVVRKPTREKRLLVRRKIDRLQPIVAIPLRYLEAGEAIGVHDDGGGLELYIGDTPSPIVSVPGRPTVGLAPGARHVTKQWPTESWTGLVDLLLARDARVVLFGGIEDRDLCVSIGGGRPGVVNLAGRLDWLQSAAAADVCDVVVTNDSAMTHIAAARARPVVAIFGSTVQQFGFAPFRVPSIVVENVGLYCRPCTTIGRAACPEGHFRCMREITADDVARAVSSLLEVDGRG